MSEPKIAQLESDDKTTFGFWVYLMTDCVLFASLFATFAVLRHNTFGGPDGSQLFSMPFVLAETLILLTSSFLAGLAVVAARRQRKNLSVALLVTTLLLGVAFLTLELTEFTHLVADGNSWQRSGFLSAFFTLVGTHGLHIACGLLWLLVLLWQIMQKGYNRHVLRRLTLFSYFWHFLDVVWIFIFTVVYLMEALRV